MTKGNPFRANTRETLEALEIRYQLPEWCFHTEVTVDRRRADGIAFNLFESRGREIHGFEVKVSRSDLVRERKNHSAGQRHQILHRQRPLELTGLENA